ncbi:MAG: hypothetical protein FWC16_14045 [Defluviitaleaceae bacterium]|nr:hypothetical protein [Defluviitaleaceae bacterium]MCL2276034.1 hypothetical protein [Defluviitaleaceae bacterium]
MQLKTAISYNLDMLCFLNIMNADDLFMDIHKESFDQWHPTLSDEVKANLNDWITQLCENEKTRAQTFENYFIEFVNTLQ